MPASNDIVSAAIGSVPAHGSPVCTVVAPVRTGAVPGDAPRVAVPAAVRRAAAAGTGTVAPACAEEAPSVSTTPLPVAEPEPSARAITIPAAPERPFPAVLVGAATETVVCNGVPVKKDFETPGVIETVRGVPAGGATVTDTDAAVAASVTLPFERSTVAEVAACPTSTLSSGPPPAPAPSRRATVAPVSTDRALSVPPLVAISEVDGPRVASTNARTVEPVAFAARRTTVASGRPDVGSEGSEPRTPASVEASGLSGVTGVGSNARSAPADVEPPDTGASSSVPTLPLAVAAGRPVGPSWAAAALHAASRVTAVENGAGKLDDGCAVHACASVSDAPGADAVARRDETCVGLSSPDAAATTGEPLPAETVEVAATRVRPSKVSRIPVPEAESRYDVTAADAGESRSGASDPAAPARPRTAAAAPAIHPCFMAVPPCPPPSSAPRRLPLCPPSRMWVERAGGPDLSVPCKDPPTGIATFRPAANRGTREIRWSRNHRAGGGTREPVTTLDGAVDLARDRELVERCQSGDEGSFAELYDRYHRRLLRFCLRRLHSRDDAEEAAQETFTRAWRALPKFGGDRRFYPWLTVIAANVCTDMLRRRARVVPMGEMPRHAVELDGEDVDAQLLRQVDLATATEALAHLSDRHQRVLRLRESTEWSAQRIAESEGLAVPAVDTLLWRARQAFKREFATLSDPGDLAGILGIAIAALRRSVARAWLRVASHVPVPMRGSGVLAATVALMGAAIAGGSIALVGAGPAPHPLGDVSASPTSSASQSFAASPDGTTSSGAGTTGRSGAGAVGAGAAAGSAPQRSGVKVGGSTAASGLAGVLAGVSSGTKGSSSVATTALRRLFSTVGGITGGQVGSASTATAGGTPIITAVGTATGTVGGITSRTPAGTLSTLATSTTTFATSTTLPLTASPPPGGSSATTSGSTSTGSLLGGL